MQLAVRDRGAIVARRELRTRSDLQGAMLQGTRMLVTRLQLKNWRNFRELDISLRETTYLLGPNASGKSNLLDVFRFLRDISKPRGGGLQAAMADRGGISKVRCLHARRDPIVEITVDLANRADTEPSWRYVLGFKTEGKGARRLIISREEVWRDGEQLLSRPDEPDRADPTLLTQTHLEQIQANSKFRDLAEFFGSTTYLHLVPQLLKYADKIGGQRIEDDPFGQGFLERIAKTPERLRRSRLKRIEKFLKVAVPQFQELTFNTDERGHPHLEARYLHHRPNAGWQREEHFSDGTLRLIGLLWSLLSGDSLLLLEEPGISLNEEIVERIPEMLHGVQRDQKSRRQILISTHSSSLLRNPGIDGRGIVLLESSSEGSTARPPSTEEQQALQAGLSPAEVMLPRTRPAKAHLLGSQ